MINNWTTSRQVFVNYTPEDQAFAARLADDLSHSGTRVWLDIRDARPGRYWNRSIEQALSDSSMMIVILSCRALKSSHVAVEWQAYLEAFRPVIPVLIEPCDLPGPLRTRRPIDFTRERDYTRSIHQLVTRLIDYGTRIRRSDPVIWTLTENVIEYRESRAPVVISFWFGVVRPTHGENDVRKGHRRRVDAENPPASLSLSQEGFPANGRGSRRVFLNASRILADSRLVHQFGLLGVGLQG